MSFGFSVGDLVLAIGIEVRNANVIRPSKLERKHQQLYQALHQLALSLVGLSEACKPTDLDIIFIADYKVCIKNALHTTAQANRLLLSTGLVSASTACSNLQEIGARTQPAHSEGDMESLRSDLRQRANEVQLLLVCEVENEQILREALRNDDWLRSRVFATIAFEKHQHPGHRCQQKGTVCCSEEGPDLVSWSIIRLLEERKKQSFAEESGNLDMSPTTFSYGGQTALKVALQGDKSGKTKTTARALQYVSFARRPLHIDELLEALATDPTSDFEGKLLGGQRSSVQSVEDFAELTSDFLEVRDNGLVFFRDRNLRRRLSTEEIVPMDSYIWRNGHEVMAMLCLQHLECLGRETILKPWASTNGWLADRRHECRLHSYATAFWHEHSRLAEDQSRHLPGLLHRTIFSALALHRLESKEHILALRDKVNSALWVSAAYGLRTLCKTYLEMGGDLSLVNNWHQNPLHILSSPLSQRCWRLCLGFGEELAVADDRLQAMGQPTRFATSNFQGNSLKELPRGFDTCHRADDDVSTGFYHHGLSPLQLASICGHSLILKLFQEHANFAPPVLKNKLQPCVVKWGQCEIQHEGSTVISANSRACELGENVKRKRHDQAGRLVDVQRSLHSLSLAENKDLERFHSSPAEYSAGVADCNGVVADCSPPEDREWFFVTSDDIEMGFTQF